MKLNYEKGLIHSSPSCLKESSVLPLDAKWRAEKKIEKYEMRFRASLLVPHSIMDRVFFLTLVSPCYKLSPFYPFDGHSVFSAPNCSRLSMNHNACCYRSRSYQTAPVEWSFPPGNQPQNRWICFEIHEYEVLPAVCWFGLNRNV